MIIKLINLADKLDKHGYIKLANKVDELIKLNDKPKTCLETDSTEGWQNYHQWLKENVWEQLKYKGIQKGHRSFEIRDCNLCLSTIYKEITPPSPT